MNLTIKSSGDDVKTIQEMLAEMGFQPGSVDGLYGGKTEVAVIKFQEEQGLYADGVVGPNTWNAIF
ncbi:hypothetical protein GCM10007978_11620 [Shewanella hanedai]|uniref:peptidoglycan-binding domain-containing protein n=1 Tax=Shewanella hanedai TaxID=25 RepID=UPI00199B0E21|nr:peptidoglycan-binding domain-containing protein [Shewanella hanedai]GGI75694.1 hypothetical protein GCM10007978_11620 [Shewanella hanedai]